MNDSAPVQTASPHAGERRGVPERRRRHWYGLWQGHFMRRRLGPRRRHDQHLAIVDWHHPQWLLVAMLIVLLSMTDGLLTIELLSRGASEINPFMKPLVAGHGGGFAYWKMGLTIGGVVLLTALSQMRVFGRWRVGNVLYALLAVYVTLVSYEVWLLTSARFH